MYVFTGNYFFFKFYRMSDSDKIVSSQPITNVPSRKISTPSRKVSINTNVCETGPFESRSRKVSAASEHAEMGPVRKKSILHNANHHQDNPAFIHDGKILIGMVKGLFS